MLSDLLRFSSFTSIDSSILILYLGAVKQLCGTVEGFEGSMVAQRLALLPHTTRDPGLIPPSGDCVEFAHSLPICAIHQKILDNNFIILMHKYLKWDQEESRTFYAEHSGRFFYQRVVEFMTSGPMRAYILAREDAIQRWRHLMGPTKVF
eukprot:g36583.t1